MTYVTEILADESGVQYQGVKDKTGGTGTYPIAGLITGKFRRGRFDRSMTITEKNIRGVLGHDSKNPYYRMVQDVLNSGVESVQVLRIQGDYFDVKPAPIFGSWILNPGVSILNGVAAYTGYKTNTIDTYDSHANLDLTAAIVRSLHDSDMQQWQAVKDAVNELTGVTDWNFDNNTSVVKYVSVIGDAPNPLFEYKVDDVDKICQTMRETAEVWLNRYRPGAIVGVQRIYDVSNGQTIAIRAGAGISSTYTWNNAPTDSKVGVVINRVNPMPIIDPVEVTYSQIAQKIISNASSSNQAISLLAEAYLEAVANSIFNADESKRFVKLTDLYPLFEANKVLRIL